MTKRSLLICTSVAALTLATGSAMAQNDRASPESGAGAPTEMAPSAGGNAPPASRMEEPGAGSGLERGDRATEPGASPGDFTDVPGRGGSEKKARDTAKSPKDERDGPASTGASEGEAGRDMPKAAEKDGQRPRNADDRTPGEDASSRASEGAEGRDQAPSGSATQLSGEKRTKVQSAFRSHRSEAVVRDIDIDVKVGVTVPRTVTLYAVPEEVVVIAPAYRRYKYFIYEDRVIIVDPVTFAIVDVIVLA